MGWLSDTLKKITGKKQGNYAEVMNGGAPIFSQFGQNIYVSDVVQQAISCIVTELKKLRPEHIIENGTDVIPVSGDLQRVLNNPNPLMTTSDFLEKVGWIYFLNYNAFIIPVYYEWVDGKDGTVKRRYEALYPILPSQVDFIEDASGALFVKFYFPNGKVFDPIRYSDVIHLKKNYSVNDYMGGNEAGQPDNGALLQTLDINHQLLQGVASAMKASFAVNAVVKYNTLLDEGKTEAALKELEKKLKNSESGFLALDLKNEFVPIKKEIQLVDDKTLKFIDEKILRHFGVSLPILTGDYTKSQYEAFYQKAIEPIVISWGQSFTKSLLAPGQRSRNQKIKLFVMDLIFMSIDQKIQMIKELAPTGSLYENEKRVMFGLKPMPELAGKRYMSLNWIDATKANEYQIGNNGGGDNG